MQIRFLAGLFLFLGSYFPLSLILGLQDVNEKYWKLPVCNIFKVATCVLPSLNNPGRSIGLMVICLASLLILLWTLRKLPSTSELTVVDSKSIPNDLINYIFPYVVSLMGLDIGSSGKFYGFILFVAWMFLITYRSGQILMNPVLLLVGWKIYELNVTVEGQAHFVRALSRDRVNAGDKVKSCLVQGMRVLHKKANDDSSG